MKKINIILLILFLSNHFYVCSAIRKKINTTPITQITNFQCQSCQKYFANLGNLNRHLKTHQEIILSCEYCKNPFDRKDNLKRHIALCKLKEESNKNQNNLKVYDEKTSTTKPYCTSCNKFFNTPSNLSQHLKVVHEKSFPCSLEKCKNKYFTSQFKLDQHKQKYHGITIQQQTISSPPHTQNFVPPLQLQNFIPTLELSFDDSLDSLFK